MNISTYSKEDQYSVLEYLKDSLSDAERRDIDSEYFTNATKITFSDIKHGKINPDIAKQLIEQYELNLEEKKSQEPEELKDFSFDENNTSCSVLICPFRRLPKNKKRHYDTEDSLTPLWIPAELNEEGELKVSRDLFPWIERGYLFARNSTSRQKKEQMLGSIEDEEEYLTRNPISEVAKGWNSYLEWAFNFIKHFSNQGNFDITLTEKEVTTFTFGGDKFLLDDHAYIAPDPDTISGASEAIIKLYNELIDERQSTALLESFCDIRPENKQPIISEENVRQQLTSHLGQLKGEHPLAKSQRQALHHFSVLKDGEVLAVNGPPGTGKTTLLQSVVANLVVEKALAGNEPPIILASSANNQAITNIIESFEADLDPDDQLSSRWLPHPVSSFGLYCPSSTKLENGIPMGIHYTDFQGGGFPTQVENKEFVNQAQKIFREKAEEHFGESFSNISEIKVHLHSRLEEMKQTLVKGEKLFEERKKSEQLLGAQTVKNKKQIEEELISIHSNIETLEHKIADISQQLKEIQSIKSKWEKSYQNLPFYTRWFQPIISSFKKQIKIHNQLFFEDHSLSPDSSALSSYESVLNYFSDTVNQLYVQKSDKKKSLAKIENYRHLLIEINQWFKEHISIQESDSDKKELSLVDIQLRYKMFLYATHYWESRWLMEIQYHLLKKTHANTKENEKKKWLRYAKLTPCFVSTFYMLPKFFSHFDHYFLDFADLLIVEEAGQVTPEIGGANFSLAKKALVVGDINQIQPIWSVNKTIDKENAGTILRSEDFNYHEFRQTGKTADGGSIMRVAQQRSPFQLKNLDVGGMFLSEHWRCVPEIIDYCNTLVYEGGLEPQLESGKSYHLPRMGFAHISGESQKDNSSSRYNEPEAVTIVNWIADNKKRLIDESEERTIEDVIAIITPFKRQASVIQQLLKKEKEGLSAITVGTVHSLQGAERDVIIFSSVYDQNDSGNYFFDQDVMMLNVAVSRAKKSFLVFGDMHIFNPTNTEKPSGLLAQYLFANYQNELTDISFPESECQAEKDPQVYVKEVVDTHQEVLNYCFEHAVNEITIASPFITEYAIKSADLPQLIQKAINRGVSVTCYVNLFLNKDHRGNEKQSARKGKKLLKDAGATVKVAKNFHNKTLCVDEFLISEGSFNWLSAQRKKTDKYHRYERSLVYLSKDRSKHEIIKQIIQSFEKDMNERLLN